MKNLFVMHTQYNLITSLAMIYQQYVNDENDLILFADFKVNESLENVLYNSFNKVCILIGTYPAVNKTWKAKAKRFPGLIVKINNFIGKKGYDRLFWVCDDSIPELYILKNLKRKNSDLYVAWLEDGSFPYFENHVRETGLNKNIYARSLRFIIGKIIFGKYYSYNGTTIACNNWTKEYWVTFPKAVREKFNSKCIKLIKQFFFQKAIKQIYAHITFTIAEDSVLLFMDKIDVYKDFKLIEDTLIRIINICQNKNRTVYYKYHPREEDEFKCLKDQLEIPRNIGVEGILACNQGKNLLVIGIKSTALQSAKECGFKVISVVDIVKESDKNVHNFYDKIGVNCLTNIKQLNKFI